MSWIEEERQKQNEEDYQSYRITQALKGKMTNTREGVIRLIKGKGYDHEKIQNKRRQSASGGTDDTAGTRTDSDTGTGESLY